MKGMIKRNLYKYFNERMNIFYSLLSVIILLLVYVLFLSSNFSDLSEAVSNGEEIVYKWIYSGLLCIATFTTTQAVIGYRTEDRYYKIDKDFLSSPIKRTEISLGYIISAVIVGFIMSSTLLGVIQLFLLVQGVPLFGLMEVLKIEGLIFLSVCVNASMLFLASTFFESEKTWNAFSTLTGTLIGFITGMYIPLSTLSSTISLVATTFPQTVAMTLFKKTMVDSVVSQTMSGQNLEETRESLSLLPQFMGREVSEVNALIILVVFMVVFSITSSLRIKKHK